MCEVKNQKQGTSEKKQFSLQWEVQFMDFKIMSRKKIYILEPET